MAKSVLIVDDDADFRSAMELILNSDGYDVLHAASGSEAHDVLAAGQVDMILLDVMMETDTEGFHLAYEIRKDDRLKDIPIIITTCLEEKTGETLDPATAGEFLPVQAYLRKPVDADQLKAKVAELIG